jgi:site-specific recombinase XerC
LGERLVDRYLEFVAGRCRPNTLRAVAFDLKAFFTVTGRDPAEVTAADVFDFLAHQRGDRRVVRLVDRESGLSARTITRRLSSVSGLYAYLVAPGWWAFSAEDRGGPTSPGMPSSPRTVPQRGPDIDLGENAETLFLQRLTHPLYHGHVRLREPDPHPVIHLHLQAHDSHSCFPLSSQHDDAGW